MRKTRARSFALRRHASARPVSGALSVASVCVLAASWTSTALAQQSSAVPQEAAAPPTQPLQEVTVTGSRIARRDYVANSPIVTVSQSTLQNQAGGTFALKLQQMPQFTPGANQLVGSGLPTGRATVDLRGLGANRTLVLADGRRLEPSTGDLVVDLNTIPAALIDSVEIITGGASAVYGSDAIAGVVNLKLKRHFQGLQLSGQYNETELQDDREKTFDILMGTNFADGRGNVVLDLNYLNRGAAYFRNRDFYTRAFKIGAAPWGSDLLPQGNFIPDPSNLPSAAAVNSVFQRYGVAAGTVSPAAALSFNADGSLFAQAGAVNYRGPQNNAYVVSPLSNAVAYNLGTLQLLSAPTTRYSAFMHGQYRMHSGITAYMQGIFTKYHSITNYGAGLQTQGTAAVVPADNPFIPADLAALLASRPDPTAPFTMHKLWTQTGTSVTLYDNTVYQMLAGLKGVFGNSDWTWNVYGSHGHTDIDVTQQSGSASFSRIQELLTSRSVTGPDGALVHVPSFIPSANGSNSLIPNPAYATAVNDGGRSLPGPNGAAPPCPQGLDLFSDQTLAPSCADFLQIHPTSITRLQQNIIEADAQGGVVSLPAGQLRLAVGATYRENKYDFIPDPAGGDLVGSFVSEPVSGATRVKEGYVEALIPVVKDLPLIEQFDLDTGYRYSDYDLSGGVSTYMADFDWKMIDTVRLRGGYQRAIRAPNVIELFNPAVPAPALLGHADPCNFNSSYRTGPDAAQIRALCIAQGVPASIVDSYETTFAGTQAIQKGNTSLSPEKADTFTFGAVWSPVFEAPLLRTLSASVDYYNLKLEDAISTLSADIVFARCFGAGYNPSFQQSNTYCQSILRNPATGAPDQTLTPYFNLGGLKTSGIDIQADWGFGLGAVGLSDAYGRMELHTVVNRLIRFEVQASQGAPWVDYTRTYGYSASGDNGAHPHWKADTTLAWSNRGKMLGLRWYYVGSMRDIVGGPGIDSYSRFDLFAGWQATQALYVTAGINNITNKEPLETFGGLPGNTDSGTYDTLGRRYYIGFTARLL